MRWNLDTVAKEVKRVFTKILVLKFHVIFVQLNTSCSDADKVNKHTVVTSANKSTEQNECIKYNIFYIMYI